MLTRNHERQLVFDGRFCGLPGIPQGGYVAGVIAAGVAGAAAAVRLRATAPTGRTLTLERFGGTLVEFRDGDTLVAEAAPASRTS